MWGIQCGGVSLTLNSPLPLQENHTLAHHCHCIFIMHMTLRAHTHKKLFRAILLVNHINGYMHCML